MDSITTALSGLRAQSAKTAISAENIANAQSVGYTPKDAVLTSSESGVEVSIQSRQNATVKTYSPDSVLADNDGFVSVPEISYEYDIINMMTAETAYKANISVIKTSDEMQDALLDVLT